MTDVRVVAVVQARLGSSRLPRKVLVDIDGEPMLLRIARRLRRSERITEVVVSTSDDASDDELVDVAKAAGLAVARGPVDDIIGRLASAARLADAGVVVRVWGDCPFIDGSIVDVALATFDRAAAGFLTNSAFGERTYPAGLDLEVYRMALLDELDRAVTDPKDREFPARMVLADHEDQAQLLQLPVDLSHVHLTVDYPADLDAARSVAAHLREQGDPLGVDAVVAAADAVRVEFADAPRNIEYRAYLDERSGRR